MNDRAERREEIKLKLEYAKMIVSVAGIVTILFAGLQWAASNRTNTEAVYQRMASAWTDHLKTFIDKPALRPYFEGGKALGLGDGNEDIVFAIADVRLDVADAILTYAALHGYSDQIGGWKRTFADAFRTSPVMCSRIQQVRKNFGLVVPIAIEACKL
jgi:hypothetical protein